MRNQIQSMHAGLRAKLRIWTDLLSIIGIVLIEHFSAPVYEVSRVKRDQRPVSKFAGLPIIDLGLLAFRRSWRLRKDDFLYHSSARARLVSRAFL